MKTKEQKMLEELVTKNSKEYVALKFDVTTRTIERWIAGDNRPGYGTRKYISQVYNGYKAQEKK